MSQKIDKAVALSFDPMDPTVPAVVASGSGELARKIVDLAFLHNVKVREDPDLVEMLSALDIGEFIPAVAFAAIAEILTHVYQWETSRQQEMASSWSTGGQSEMPDE